MKGLWKENLGGWNNKDSKRKKQSRSQTIRDNGKAILKVFDSRKNPKTNESIFREETPVVYISGKKLVKRQFIIEIWKILVDNYRYNEYVKFDEELKYMHIGKTTIGYKYHNKWYDPIDGNLIEGNIKTLNKLDSEFVNWDENLDKYVQESRTWGRYHVQGKDFIYNRPLERWKRSSLYNYAGKRKEGQKVASKLDRAKVREWIERRDWDNEMKTHYLSKSIGWYLY